MESIVDAYKAFCNGRFPLPSEQQVQALEMKMGVDLPADYRRYILEFNGGFFSDPDIVAPDPDCPQDALHQLDGIGATHDCAELGSDSALTMFDDNSPTQILPIGYTIMGNLLLLITDPDPEDQGVIMLKKAFSQQYFTLADGIEEFFGLLRAPTI